MKYPCHYLPLCLVLVGSKNGFEPDFTIEGLMEDWLKCQLSTLVKYRQNRILRQTYEVKHTLFANEVSTKCVECDCWNNTEWQYRVTIPSDNTAWQYRVTIPSGNTEWQYRETIPSDNTEWQYRVTIPSDNTQWQYRVTIPSDNMWLIKQSNASIYLDTLKRYWSCAHVSKSPAAFVIAPFVNYIYYHENYFSRKYAEVRLIREYL